MAARSICRESCKRDAQVTRGDIVVDTNVFIVSLIDESQLNAEERAQRPSAIAYIDGLENGHCVVHLPRIAFIEIIGVTRSKTGAGTASAIKNRLEEWASLGLLKLYALEEARMNSAVDLVMRHNLSKRRSLSAADAEFIALAEELEISLITFEKYFPSVSARALVPA